MQCECAVLSSVACPALRYFFPHIISHKRHDFRKKKKKRSLNTKCVFWFSVQLLSETFLVLRRTERDMIKNVYRSSCKVNSCYCQIVMKLEFSRQIFRKKKILKYQISWKSVSPLRAEFHSDEVSCPFSQFWQRTLKRVLKKKSIAVGSGTSW